MEEKKIVSIEDRIPKLKEARKKKANRRLLFYLAIFFFLISIIVYLQSPLSYVKKIDVIGSEFVEEQDVIQYSEIKLNANLWMVNKNAVKKALESHPLIEQAEIQRRLPQTIQIK